MIPAVTKFSNGHAVTALLNVPASPLNYEDILSRALSLPNGVEQFNLLASIKSGHPAYSYPRGGKPGRAHQRRGDPRVSALLKQYSDFTWYCGLNLTPNYVQAVAEYNQGKPLSQPWFEGLFATMNNYQKQGAAGRGRLTAQYGKEILQQWIQDAKEGGFEKTMDAVQAYATMALAAYMGGVFAGQLGVALGKAAGKYELQQEFAVQGGPVVNRNPAPAPPSSPAAPVQSGGLLAAIDNFLTSLGL